MMTTPAPQIKPVSSEDHSLGREDVAHDLIIYGDYQCPFTRVEYRIAKQYRKRFEDKLRFTFRHFPLTNLHPHALASAEAVEAAALQGKFWEMSDVLFDNQDRLDHLGLLDHAISAGLDIERFERDLASKTPRNLIQHSLLEGRAAGVRGTPAVYLNGNYVGSKVRKPLLKLLKST